MEVWKNGSVNLGRSLMEEIKMSERKSTLDEFTNIGIMGVLCMGSIFIIAIILTHYCSM